MIDPDPLTTALAGLLGGPVRLPEPLIAFAADRCRDRALPRSRISGLELALARYPGTPVPLLAELGGIVDRPDADAARPAGGNPRIVRAVLSNPACPEDLRRALTRAATDFPLLRALAEDSSDRVVLAELVRRTCAQPRPLGARTAMARTNSKEHITPGCPRPGFEWEDLAVLLLCNAALPSDLGQKLLTTLLDYLDLDVAVLPEDGDTYGSGSLAWIGVRRWLGREPQTAFALADSGRHRWILVTVPAFTDCPPHLARRAFPDIIEPDLSAAGPGGGRSLPDRLARLTVAVAPQLRGDDLHRLRTLINDGWDLHRSHIGLPAIAQPVTISEDSELLALLATGPIVDGIDELRRRADATGSGWLPRELAATFLQRPDLPCEAAVRLAVSCRLSLPTILRVRPGDVPFISGVLAAQPGMIETLLRLDDAAVTAEPGVDAESDVGVDAEMDAADGVRSKMLPTRSDRVEYAVAGLTAYAGRTDRGHNRVTDLVRPLLPLLGDAAHRLPWPVLAMCAGHDAALDGYLAEQLSAAVALTGADRLLPLLAEGFTGDVDSLLAAVTGALTAGRTTGGVVRTGSPTGAKSAV
jgi:hypothetical protein